MNTSGSSASKPKKPQEGIHNTIYTFWEPKNRITPYLRLCMQTWGKNIPDYEVVVLDYANLQDYIPENIVELLMRTDLSYPVQKDAIQAMILHKYGGIFMDADTIITKDITPVFRHLKKSELVMFGFHMAFMAARPGSKILEQCCRKAEDKLIQLENDRNGEIQPAWDYLGNSILEQVTMAMVDQSPLVEVSKRIKQGLVLKVPRLEARLQQFIQPVWSKRRGLFFRTGYKKYLTRLDRQKYGYIAEASYFGRTDLTPQEQYHQFWFDECLGIEDVFKDDQLLIGLHNSWTPSWYKELSEKEALEHPCLLSKTLKHILIEKL